MGGSLHAAMQPVHRIQMTCGVTRAVSVLQQLNHSPMHVHVSTLGVCVNVCSPVSPLLAAQLSMAALPGTCVVKAAYADHGQLLVSSAQQLLV